MIKNEIRESIGTPVNITKTRMNIKEKPDKNCIKNQIGRSENQ